MDQPADLTPELINRLRKGDAEAGLLLDRLYRDAMARFTFGYLGRIEEAEDAVQEIFCKVLAADVVPDNFRAWLYKIARNYCLNTIRNRNRRRGGAELPSDTRLWASQTGHLTRLVKIEQEDKLAELLANLTPEQQEALRLRYTEGLARAEIAEVLEITESVVKSRLFEGLKKLRESSDLMTGR